LDTGDIAALGARLKVFGMALLATVIDLLFVAGWILLHELADIWLFSRLGRLPGVEFYVVTAFEYLMAGSTGLLVSVYIIRDLMTSVRRIWGRRD
jgi:hypothetical protein